MNGCTVSSRVNGLGVRVGIAVTEVIQNSELVPRSVSKNVPAHGDSRASALLMSTLILVDIVVSELSQIVKKRYIVLCIVLWVGGESLLPNPGVLSRHL